MTKKEEKEKVEKEDKDLNEALKETPKFGLVTIFATHPVESIYDYLIMILPLLLLVAQVVLPICLLIEEVKSYRRKYNQWRFCPGEAPPNQKILTLAIAIVYFSRSLVLTSETKDGCFSSRRGFSEQNEALYKTRELQHFLNFTFGQVDAIMDVTFEGYIYIVNMFIVFITEDALNMVLNALALEFVMKLDDEFKALYFENNGKAVTRIKENRPPLPKSDYNQIIIHFTLLA